MRIKKEDSILLAVDFQEKLMPVIKNNEEIAKTVVKLVKGCNAVDVPVMVTQQYTKGLGDTIEEIKNEIKDFSYIEKSTFSCCGGQDFMEALKATGKNTVILTGVEAHICVLQTALDLLENGYKVFLVYDCIGSRNNNDKKYAGRRMCDAGAIGTTYESVLFELCGGASEPGFREISKIVK